MQKKKKNTFTKITNLGIFPTCLQYEADMKFEHRKKAPIPDDTIVATAMILLIAGYDTTGMTLRDGNFRVVVNVKSWVKEPTRLLIGCLKLKNQSGAE